MPDPDKEGLAHNIDFLSAPKHLSTYLCAQIINPKNRVFSLVQIDELAVVNLEVGEQKGLQSWRSRVGLRRFGDSRTRSSIKCKVELALLCRLEEHLWVLQDD